MTPAPAASDAAPEAGPVTPPTGPAGDAEVVLALHGTASASGQRCAHDLADALGRRLGRAVRAAFVDVVGPRLADVATADSLVVPCFLGTGYHVRVDVAQVVRRTGCMATAPLVAPDEGVPGEIVDAVAGRLAAVGGPGDGVVLGWAGSSDERSRDQAAATAAALERGWGVPVRTATPAQAPEAVAELRDAGHRDVAVATYLLAPGVFADRLAALPGVRVSEPIGVHPRLLDLIGRRIARLS